MCTYSQSRASKGVSETHHMYLLMVMCNKINELTCSVRNITPLLKRRRLRWLRCSETVVAKVRMRKVMHLLIRVVMITDMPFFFLPFPPPVPTPSLPPSHSDPHYLTPMAVHVCACGLYYTPP